MSINFSSTVKTNEMYKANVRNQQKTVQFHGKVFKGMQR